MKFFYLYLIGGTVALVLVVYQLISTYPAIKFTAALIYLIPVLILYYMAYKAYHVKKDNELM
ncbi:hypothetical protein ABDD95_13045 [Mucilaginibacter sp. PAMB04274]|uniref:hypothetical protein n=1 Tax=Mucilaginibacter sp. PAMB04274 TaxID=3138568 RepID=UPI0031F70730